MSNHTLKLFPTSDAIAVAILAASELTNEPYMDAVTGTKGNKARIIAMAALVEIFPMLPPRRIAACFKAASGLIDASRKLKWWRPDWVEHVVMELAQMKPPHAPDGAKKLATLERSGIDIWKEIPLSGQPQTAIPFGEPPLERSALWQRQAQQAQPEPWKIKSISAIRKIEDDEYYEDGRKRLYQPRPPRK